MRYDGTVLVTGAAGFIGSNFVQHLVEHHPTCTVVALDSLTPYSCRASLAPLEESGTIRFVEADITDQPTVERVMSEHAITDVVNFAAESHNDRALLDPGLFAWTNALGAQRLLDASRKHGTRRHVHVSTIEVYGEQAEGTPFFTEGSALNAKTPYSAAKAAGDMLVRAYMHTYRDMQIFMTHCANNYGPHQFPEKLIPLAITNVLRGRRVPLYGDGMQRRDWIHVSDHCRAIATLLTSSRPYSIPDDAATRPELLPIFDVSAREELSNRQVISHVLGALDRPFDDWVEFVADRPNHDRRYTIDPTKIETEHGFRARIAFETGIVDVVRWYVDNRAWWEAILARTGELGIDWSRRSV